MSSLIFVTNEAHALVATDTLAVSQDGTPAFWTSKAFPVPHLNMIIAGTGAAGFATRWFTHVNDRMFVVDIDNLAFHAPKTLRKMWHEFKEDGLASAESTTTVYHFGIVRDTGKMMAQALRSTAGFEVESLQIGALAVRPGCDTSSARAFPEDFRSLMEAQMKLQTDEPPDERIYIGGMIQVLSLTPGRIESFSMGKLPGFDLMENAILSTFA